MGCSLALTFNAPPDFESPDDIGGDNVYDIEVQVEDGDGGVTTGAFQVMINDLGEAVLAISGSEPEVLLPILNGSLGSVTLTVTNTGTVPATDVQPSGLDGQFIVGSNGLGTTLNPGDSGNVTVLFQSDIGIGPGTFSDVLEINYDSSVADEVATRTIEITVN